MTGEEISRVFHDDSVSADEVEKARLEQAVELLKAKLKLDKDPDVRDELKIELDKLGVVNANLRAADKKFAGTNREARPVE